MKNGFELCEHFAIAILFVDNDELSSNRRLDQAYTSPGVVLVAKGSLEKVNNIPTNNEVGGEVIKKVNLSKKTRTFITAMMLVEDSNYRYFEPNQYLNAGFEGREIDIKSQEKSVLRYLSGDKFIDAATELYNVGVKLRQLLQRLRK